MDACQPDKTASHVPQHSNVSPTMPKVHAQHLHLPQDTYLTASPGSSFQLALPRNRTMYPPPLFTACSKRLDYTNSEAPTGASQCRIYLPGTAACSKALRGELTLCWYLTAAPWGLQVHIPS